MNAKIRMIGLLMTVVAAVAATGLGELRGQAVDELRGQDLYKDPYGPTTYETNPFDAAGAAGRRGRRKPSFTQRLNSLKSTLSSPNASDEQKANAKQEIEALLIKYFDEDIETRQAKITEIEQRIAKLKTQLQKRRAAKSELVQLQMKLIENEAAGLGFFGIDDPRQTPGGLQDFLPPGEPSDPVAPVAVPSQLSPTR